MRRLAGEAIVLIKNENNALPLRPAELKKVAIVGGNAKAIVLSGGGSAALKPSFFITPYDGIVRALPECVEVTYSEGAPGEPQQYLYPHNSSNSRSLAYMTKPSLDFEMITETGERGWVGSWYKHIDDDSMVPLEQPLEQRLIDETRMLISTSTPKGITRRWTMKLKGQLKPKPYDRKFEFGLAVAGRAKVR
jgi:beta-glucosidase